MTTTRRSSDVVLRQSALVEASERLPLAARYVLACALSLAAVGGAQVLDSIQAPAIFAPALLVTALSIWLFGAGPAIVASSIGAVLIPVLVQRPASASWFADRGDAVGWVAFLFTTAALLALGIGLRSARTRAQGEMRRSSFLAAASLALDSPASLEDRLQRLADLAVPALADWCAIDLVGSDGTIRLGAVAHTDPEMRSWALSLRERFRPDPDATAGVPNVLRTGQPEMYSEITDEMLVAGAQDEEHLAALRRVGFTSALVAPLIARERALGALTLVNSGTSRRLGEADLELACELAGRAALSLDIAGLYEAEVATTRRLEALQRVTAALTDALTVSGVCEAVLREGSEAFGADAGVIALIEDGYLRVVAAEGYSPAMLAAWDDTRVDDQLPGPEAARTGRAVMVGSRVELEDRYPGLRGRGSIYQGSAAVPLILNGGSHGFLGFSFSAPRAFAAEDEAFLSSIAQLTTGAMARAQAHDAQRVIAQTLQSSLLPGRLPPLEHLEIAVRYRPLGDGAEVGGDFYDVIEMDGEVLLVIGDVCGKGVEAAALSSLARYTLRALAEPDSSPRVLLGLLNAAVRRQQETGSKRFLTAAVCSMRRSGSGWDVVGCSAGHPFPMIVDPAGTVAALGVPGTLIGPFADVRLVDVSARLERGDALVLRTDGVDEARRAGVMFGEDRLRHLLEHRPLGAAAIVDLIEGAVVRHRAGALQDDLALVVAVGR